MNNHKNSFVPATVFIIVLATLLSIFGIQGGHSWGDDFASYIMQAKSLSKDTDAPYVEILEFRVLHSTKKIGPNVYPWGYPSMLAALRTFCGDSIYCPKIANVLILGLTSVLIAIYSRRFIQCKWHVVALSALIVFNPYFVKVSQMVLSDIPALFLATLATFVFDRIKVNRLGDLRLVVLAAFISALAVLFRTQYVYLLAIYIVYACSENYKNARPSDSSILLFGNLAVFCFFSGTLLFFSGYIVPVTSSYSDHISLRSIAHEIFPNLKHYSLALASTFGFEYISWPINIPWIASVAVDVIIFVTTIPAIIIGIRRTFRASTLNVVSLCISLLVPVLYPWNGNLRLILFSIPFYLLLVIYGLESIDTSKYVWRHYKNFMNFVVISVLACFIYNSAASCYRSIINGPFIQDGPYADSNVELFQYISGHTSRDSTFVFFKPRALSLFTERRSAVLNDISEVDPEIINYVVLHKQADVLGLGSALQIPTDWTLVFSNSVSAVYKTK